MAINVGSLPISTDTANWLKVRSAISDSSVRAQIAKIVERDVSKSKSKWLNDLEIAASERGLKPDELFQLLIDGKPLPEVKNPSASIDVLIKQRDAGKLYSKKERGENESEE